MLSEKDTAKIKRAEQKRERRLMRNKYQKLSIEHGTMRNKYQKLSIEHGTMRNKYQKLSTVQW